MRSLLIFWAIAAAAWAQSGLRLPRPGFLRDADGYWRAAYGVGGNLLFREASSLPVSSGVSNGRESLVQSENALVLWDESGAELQRWPVDGTPGLLALSEDGSYGAVFVNGPARLILLSRDGGMLDIPAEWGATKSLAIAGGRVRVLLRTEDRWQIAEITRGAEFRPEFRDVEGPGTPLALTPEGRVIRLVDEQMMLEQNAVQGAQGLGCADCEANAMSTTWIHLRSRTANAHWALQLDAGQARLWALPGGAE